MLGKVTAAFLVFLSIILKNQGQIGSKRYVFFSFQLKLKDVFQHELLNTII